MPTLDSDLVRHALKTAQEHGFAEVEIGVEGGLFRARLDPAPKKKVARVDAIAPKLNVEGEMEYATIKSPIVGYYRVGPLALGVGKNVSKGDIVAVVNALGIANDVESQVSGEIIEVMVQDGQAVEFGQVLAKVKP